MQFPLPNSNYNHQFFNAKYLADKNSAIIFEEKNFNYDKFKNIFINLVKDNIKIESMKKSLKAEKMVQLFHQIHQQFH